MREYIANKRATETPEQREARLQEIRQRCALRREDEVKAEWQEYERNKKRLEPQSEENKKNEEVSRNRLGMQMGNTFHNMGSEHVLQHEP